MRLISEALLVPLRDSSSTSNWESTDSDQTIRHTHDDPAFQLRPYLIKDLLEVEIDAFGFHVMESEDYDARKGFTAGCDELREIQVVGQQNVALFSGFQQDRWIGESVQALVVEMDRFMAKPAKESASLGRDPHIEKESHAGMDSIGSNDS